MSERLPIEKILRDLRKGAGLTQAGLAARVGGTQRRITNIERGIRRPNLELVEAWAEACGRRFLLDFPPAGDEDPKLMARVAAAQPELRRVILEILSVERPSEAALRALEGHVAAWRAHSSGRTER